MAELTLTTFLTLDGVMQAPGGPNEDPSGNFPHGGWLVPLADDDMGATMIEIFSKEVIDLKQRFSREVQVHGSCGLAQTLIEKDLIDEYRLLTFPVILGTGKRLFGAGAVPASLTLVRSHTTSKGMVVSVYRRAGSLKTGSFALD